MPDIGFTHIALQVRNLETSAAFYAKYAGMQLVHRRAQRDNSGRQVGWLSDSIRPFVLVLVEAENLEPPLGPFSHLGVACATREEVDRLCELARAEGCLREAPGGGDGPAGYYGNLADPDGHTLELSFGQETGLAAGRFG